MEPNSDPDDSDTSDVDNDEAELESNEGSESSIDPEMDNKESVSELWRVVRGISEVLARLEESNTQLVAQTARKTGNTTSVPLAKKSTRKAKTKSDESTSSELHDLMSESGNFDEMRSPPIKKRFQTDRTDRKTRRESRLITSMKYNSTRADMAKVYNMKTTEPFAMRLTKLTPSAFLNWFTKWNEHMHRTGCYTAPTSLVSEEIRETLMDSIGCTMEDFHELEPDQFIEIVADQIKCRSKSHFATIMKNCYGKLEVLDFKGVVPNTHRHFFEGLLKRRTYFFRVFEFLNISNSAYTPLVKGDMGLAKILMSTIGKRYCDQVLLEIDPKTDYKSIKKFTDAFMAIAKRHYELGDASCAVPYEQKGYMDDQEEDGQKPTFKSSKSYVPYKRGSEGFQKTKDTKPFKKGGEYGHVKPVYFMEQSDRSDSSSSDEAGCKSADSDSRMAKTPKGAYQRPRQPDSDDEEESTLEEDARKTPIVEDYSLAEANIPPDRTSETRALFMVGNDGETRPRGCMYYAIFGNCLKGIKCMNADGHNPEARARTGAWLQTKLDEIPKVGSKGPVKILSRDPRKTN